MAQPFEQIVQSINNTELRIAVENLFGILGIGRGDKEGSATISAAVTGGVTGNVTGDITGDVLAVDATKIVDSAADQANSVVTAGSLVGALTGASNGVHTGAVTGNVTGSATKLVVGSAPVNAVKAISTMTLGGAAVPAVHAVSVLTSTGANAAEDDTVTIGATVYTFKDDPTGIAFAVDVGTDLTTSLSNLLKAINLTGTPDTEYGTGTTINPIAWATASDGTTLTAQVKIPGDESNTAVTEASDAEFTWNGADFAAGTVVGVASTAATFTIGTRTYMMVNELSETSMTTANAIVDQVLYGASEAAALDNIKVALNAGATEGTNYSTGTVINADVVCGLNTDTTNLITAKVGGVIGNAIATTETMANFAFTSTVMAGGVDGTVADAGTVIMTGTHLHMTQLPNAIADANWRAISLEVFNNTIAAPSITLTQSLDLGETDFDSDVIFLDGTAACVITDWTPTIGRTYFFECIESTNDPVVNLTSGITIDTTANDILTFGDVDDTIVLKCISATRLVILGNIGTSLSS